MSHLDIRNALNTKLNTLANAPDIAWENVSFTPQTDEFHLRVAYIPSQTEPAANHNNAPDFESGIYQVDIYGPYNRGTAAYDVMAEAIKDLFPRGDRLTQGSTVVHIRKTPSVSTGQREGAFWRIRVTVPWFSYTF